MPEDTAWRQLMTRPLLAEDALTQFKTWLKGHIPEFQASTDPLAWRQAAARLRQAALTQVYLRGWSPAWLAGEQQVRWGEVLTPHPAYRIRKLCYQIHPQYWVPAALYEPTNLSGPAPVVLNPNGHHRGGKAADYKQLRCINLAKRGCLALNFEFIGMSELEADANHMDLAFQDLTGVAGVGFFYQAMKRGLDVVLAHPQADRQRVAMTGLSGGGWQTIVLSALDERITLTVPVAGYTAIRARIGCPRDIGDLEQAPPDLTTVLDYQDLTAMLAPRPTLIITNEFDDCCFKTADAKPIVYDAVMPVFKAMGVADKFAYYSNTQPGTHNYDQDNREQLYAFLARHWGLSGPTTEIASEAELQSEHNLLA